MVTEDYVSFETAKLLKEKGAYFDTDRVYTSIGRAWEINMKQFKKQFDYEVSNYIQRPTLQMALKWFEWGGLSRSGLFVAHAYYRCPQCRP